MNYKIINGAVSYGADTILEEVGEKWKTLDRDQKTALAQTVAGLRQYNQFAALMENYDYYKDMNLKEVEEYADLPKIEHIINRRERYNNDDYTRILHK